MIRRLAAAAAALLVTASVAIAAPRLLADLSGKWSLEIATPDQPRTSVLTIEQKGDSISGTTESSELGAAPIKGVVKGDSVFFAFSVNMNGNPLAINVSAVLKDKDTMDGLLSVAEFGAFPITGKRQP